MFTVTFYSYKGGVGRTLALANVAYTLATEGSKARVVMLDFDLEAPGLDTLVPLTGGKGAGKGGILEYIAEYWNNPEANPEALPSLLPYVREVDAIPNLAVIPAGKKDERYQETLACLDWQSFYRVRQGYRFFEQLKRKIEVEFNPDYLLVDSRTGLADVAGITTHQLADLVVLVFNLNRQNLDGIKGCYHSIVSAPKPRRIKVMLVASPVPQGHLLDSGLVESRLEDATASMPDVVNYSRTGKEPVIQIPYHPLLALRDEVFVKEYPSHEISGIYRRVAETIRKSNPAEMKFLLEKAYRYWDENRFEEAEEEFRTIVRLHPKNAEGFYLYGDFLMKRERYKDATAQLEEACRLAENDIRYLSSLGMALAKENRIEAALDKLKKAESLGSKKEAVLHAISRLYDKMGDSMKAIEYWRKIRQVNPPPTRLDRIRSIQEFDRIASEFISASLNIPEDFDRRRFVERLEKSVAFDYTMKAGILQSAMAQDFRFQQIMELDNLLASQEEQLTKVLGDHLLVVSNKVRHGDLHHFLDEGDLKRLIKNEETDSANAFRLCLALSRMNEAEYREVLDIIDDAMNTEMAEPARKPFYRLWADALSALADRADDADVKAELLDKAIEKYSEACRLQPDDHEALNHWGIALANLARTREGPEREEMLRLAMQKFERAVGIKPDDHKALNNWGNALAILARMREGAAREEMLRLAMQKYERAVDIKHDDHKALNNWGNTLADLARMREGPEREEMLWLAMQKYERAVEIKPDYHEALYNWGNALANLARTREGPEREEMLRQAMQKYERAVEIKPDAPEVLNNWGIALADLARMREGAAREEMLRQAIQKYERAVDIKHDYHEALYNWGIALADLARVREGTEREEMLRQAMQKYERAVDIKHDYHEALNNWGNALANLALLREGPEREEMLWQALQKYERAVDIKHDYHEVLNNWGIALADLARMREGPEREEMLWQALQKYERAVGIKHDYHEALNNWGNALANLALLREGTAREEILSQAMQKYERAVDIKHDFHEALNNWGNTLADLARMREGAAREEMLSQAMQKYERAVDIKHDFHEALNNWGIALADLARMREGAAREEMLWLAMQKFERAVDIKPDAPEVLNNWGIALADLARMREGPEREEMLWQATQKYERAVDIKPDDYEVLNNWGIALADLARMREGAAREEMLWLAMQKFERAVDIKPDAPEVLNNWGIALADLALLREGPEREEMLWQATQKYERAVDIKHDDHEALYNWGNALIHLSYLQEGRQREKTIEAALEKAKRVEELKPGEGIYNTACCQALLGKKRLALATLRKAVEFNSSYKKMAAEDEDFRSLREDKAFRAIVGI